jgi:CRP-like cAMP-binding protein
MVASHLRKIEILRRALDKKRGITGEFEEEAADAKSKDLKAERHHTKQFNKGEFLYHEGDRAENLYFIVSGKVKTSKINYWGKEFITDIFKEGDYFGYLALLDSHKYEESAVAIDPSQIEIIPRKDFFDLLHANGSVADSFIKMISQKLDISHEKLLSLAYDSARKKVAEALLYINRKYQITGANELAFPVKREIISSIAGLSPESVSRNLTEMSQEGLIKVYDRKIKIIDRKKLEPHP